MKLLNRRQILRGLMLSGAAAGLNSLDLLAQDSKPGQLRRSGPAQRIIVVGAGMAGLTVAMELSHAGHEVIVLEARTRAGGRVRTLREPFAEGLYAEAGAARIPATHQLTLRYVEAFGLKLAPFQPTEFPSTVHVRGKNYRSDFPGLLKILNCSPQEQALGPVQSLRKYTSSTQQIIGSPDSPAWPPKGALVFDDLSGSALLRQLGASEGLINFMDLGFGVLGELSGLDLLLQLGSLFETKYRIVGGNDKLPRAMAAELGERIHYGRPVEAVTQSGKGVRVRCGGIGGGTTVEGDRVVMALPLPVMKRIQFGPDISPDKRFAITNSQYAAVSRVFVQVRKKFWEAEKLSGFAVTDHPIEIFDASFGQYSSRGLLLAYLHEGLARRIDSVDKRKGITEVITMMTDVFPELTNEIQGHAAFSWQKEPTAEGAVALWRPGAFREIYPLLASAEGRIHFAGEHCSPWHSWIQGAIHSGIRAALEINQA